MAVIDETGRRASLKVDVRRPARTLTRQQRRYQAQLLARQQRKAERAKRSPRG